MVANIAAMLAQQPAQEIDWNAVTGYGALALMAICAVMLLIGRSRGKAKAEAAEWERARAAGETGTFGTDTHKAATETQQLPQPERQRAKRRVTNAPRSAPRINAEPLASLETGAEIMVDASNPMTMATSPPVPPVIQPVVKTHEELLAEETAKRRAAECALADMRDRAFSSRAITEEAPEPVEPPEERPVPLSVHTGPPPERVLNALATGSMAQSVLVGRTGLPMSELVPVVQSLLLDTYQVEMVDPNGADPILGLVEDS